MIPDIISFIMYLKYVVNVVSFCEFMLLLIWDLSFSHDFLWFTYLSRRPWVFLFGALGRDHRSPWNPFGRADFLCPWDSKKLRLVRLLLLMATRNLGFTHQFEWTVVYPIIYKVFIHPRWWFGISEHQQYVVDSWCFSFCSWGSILNGRFKPSH